MPQFNFKSLLSATLLLAAGILAVGFFVARPQWSKYQAAKTALNVLAVAQRKLNNSLNSRQSFLTAYQDHATDTASVNQALPVQSPSLTNLITSLGEMAQASGVTLSNVAVDESVAGQTKPTLVNAVQPVSISLSAAGSYASFRDFMIRLENNLRLIDVSHITLKADENNTLQYQLVFKTYYQK